MDATARPVPVPDTARDAAGRAAAWTYTDAFTVPADSGAATSTAWFRRMLEQPPRPIRGSLRTVWTVIGVRRGPKDDVHVLGLPILRADDRETVLSANSWLGADAVLVLEARDGALTMSSFVRARSRFTRAAWPAIGPVHRFAVRRLLSRAVR